MPPSLATRIVIIVQLRNTDWKHMYLHFFADGYMTLKYYSTSAVSGKSARQTWPVQV